MPSAVADIFSAADLQPAGVVQWGLLIPERSAGVYVVSVSEDVHAIVDAPTAFLADEAALRQWLAVRPELLLDGSRPEPAARADRLACFWLADKVVVYIGLAASLRGRGRGYYNTPLGARRPHAGGHFLKTLSRLEDLFVHYAPTPDLATAEEQMLRHFCQNVSSQTRAALPDPQLPLPFANLEFPRGRRKPHGLTGTREPRASE